jgi:C4-type Zn-finger protein
MIGTLALGTDLECQYCHKPLVWISETKRWSNVGEVYEYSFGCESCRRQYQFTDGKLRENRKTNAVKVKVLTGI